MARLRTEESMMHVPLGMMVYWRHKSSPTWRFGYTSDVGTSGLVRMGSWNGDTMGGHVVSVDEIEWKEYRR